ncbi:hypothetical protein ACGFY7_36745 [Streptomyces prunicolor]|uniref:hypothetical protein n=1 Tax=Streptomyces prunicolor TaxID=67348 RepID=UPI00371A1CE9
MARNQSTAAKRARQKQREQGGKHTELLRDEQQSPVQRLATALEAAGHTAEAQRLWDRLKPDPEWEAAKAAYERAYRAHEAAETAGATGHVLDRLRRAEEDAGEEMGVLATYEFRAEPIVCAAVLTGLAHAGRFDGSPCLRPAADVLAWHAKTALVWADGIRCPMPIIDHLWGPNRPGPAAARAAYRALAAATRLPFKGDEEWTACGELIEESAALARAGCQ